MENLNELKLRCSKDLIQRIQITMRHSKLSSFIIKTMHRSKFPDGSIEYDCQNGDPSGTEKNCMELSTVLL